MSTEKKTFHRSPRWDARALALEGARNFKMARSAHAYVRGNTSKFYEWLDSLAPRALPEGPAIWICGDCHLGNLGPVAASDGRVEIQIRDFDQAVIGNPAHDLIRLALSLAMAARGSDLPGVTTARMVEQMVEGYTEAFQPRSAKIPPDKPKAVTQALRAAQRRSWRHLAKERVDGQTAILPLGKRFWPISEEEVLAISELFVHKELKSLIRGLSHRKDKASIQVIDCAYWMKGCSSLGLLRYCVLVDVEGMASTGRDLCLIDIKEAAKAVAPRYADASMPRDNAARVVEGARHLSPHLGERMIAARLLERPVFIRELLPEDLKLVLQNITPEEAVGCARYLALVIGRAHASQMRREDRKSWQTELARNHSKALGAPSWLWTSVVELIAHHERGYLEHCRRYALDSLQFKSDRESCR